MILNALRSSALRRQGGWIAAQYRERAKLVRQKAAAMKSRLLRQELFDIARQYEELAEIAEERERAVALGSAINSKRREQRVWR